jgi:hypothetical protein
MVSLAQMCTYAAPGVSFQVLCAGMSAKYLGVSPSAPEQPRPATTTHP